MIAKAGRAMVKVVPLEQETAAPRRLGVYKGPMKRADDFDILGQDEIIRMCSELTAEAPVMEEMLLLTADHVLGGTRRSIQLV